MDATMLTIINSRNGRPITVMKAAPGLTQRDLRLIAHGWCIASGYGFREYADTDARVTRTYIPALPEV